MTANSKAKRLKSDVCVGLEKILVQEYANDADAFALDVGVTPRYLRKLIGGHRGISWQFRDKLERAGFALHGVTYSRTPTSDPVETGSFDESAPAKYAGIVVVIDAINALTATEYHWLQSLATYRLGGTEPTVANVIEAIGEAVNIKELLT